MEKVLVTGAAGCVGSHVVDQLQMQGYNAIPTGRTDCDLRIPGEVKRLFELTRPHSVIHSAACVYGIMGNMTRHPQSFVDNILINTNVLEAARRYGVRKITAMGTGCMYPDPVISLPLHEDDIFKGRPHDSEFGYASAKLAMLAQLETYAISDHIDYACVIACNMFGPRDKFDTTNGHVIPALVKKFYDAKRVGTPVTIWGNGSAQRDFLYVKDAARAVVAIHKDGHGAINIGSGVVQRIGNMVEHLRVITGLSPDRIQWDAAKPNGAEYRGYDLSRLSALGFTPLYSMREGLQETWDWYCNEQERNQRVDN